MDLQRLQKLAGIGKTLNEATESEMQMAGTVGRDEAYANFDQDQPNLTEKAPPGMEDLVLKLKKQYPGHEEKAFQTAWSIYNKKNKTDESIDLVDNNIGECAWYIVDNLSNKINSGPYDSKEDANLDALGMQWFDQDRHSIEYGIDDDGMFVSDDNNDYFVDESVPAIDSCNQDNPENADLACAMEEEFDYQPQDVEVSINHVLTDEALNYWGDRYNSLVNSFVEPYKAIGVIKKEMADEGYEQYDIDEVVDSIEDAFGEDQFKDAEFGNIDSLDEDFDLNNGYDEYHCADGTDYFPTGADSPVTKDVGPSGARQGDNPEQKKMQIAETHKELVYAYRSYLNELKINR